MFNEICINEEMLPKYTYVHICTSMNEYVYTHIYIHIHL